MINTLKELDKCLCGDILKNANHYFHSTYDLLLSSTFYNDLLEFSNLNRVLKTETKNSEITSNTTTLQEKNKEFIKNKNPFDSKPQKNSDIKDNQKEAKELYFPKKINNPIPNPQRSQIKIGKEDKNALKKKYLYNPYPKVINNIFGEYNEQEKLNWDSTKEKFIHNKKKEVTQKIGYLDKSNQHKFLNSNNLNEKNFEVINKNNFKMNHSASHMEALPSFNLVNQTTNFEIDELEETKLENDLSIEIPFIKIPPNKRVSLPHSNKSSNLSEVLNGNTFKKSQVEEIKINDNFCVKNIPKNNSKNDPEFNRMYEDYKKNSSIYDVDLKIFEGSNNEDMEFNSDFFKEIQWKDRQCENGYNSCIITENGIPIAKWAENKENLLRLVQFQKEEIDYVSIFGKIGPEKIKELDKIGWLKTSHFRGSSANWKNEEMSSEHNLNHKNDLFCRNQKGKNDNQDLLY